MSPAESRDGAVFRYTARSVYEALAMESCEGAPALRRATVLAPEIAAMRAFERRVAAGPARQHLDVARGDIERRRASNGLGCWSDSDPRFAASHVRMARDTATAGLREMERLAPGLAPLPATVSALPPARAGEFRVLARTLFETLNPPCRITTTAPDAQVMAAALAELPPLRRRLEGTPYAAQFAIAEADLLHERSITAFECVEPGDDTAAAASAAVLRETRRQIDRIAAFARL